MKIHPLLEQQLAQYLPESAAGADNLHHLLDAVSTTYYRLHKTGAELQCDIIRQLLDTMRLSLKDGLWPGRSVLVADDDDMNRMVISAILKRQGIIITETHNGSEALKALKDGNFDAVLMDIRMPGKDGLETTKYIREHINGEIPVIALTAGSYEQEYERCLAAGMSDLMTKPFDEAKIVQYLLKWLPAGLSGRQQQVAAPAKALFSLEQLKLMSRGNDEFVTKMTMLFIQEVPLALVRIKKAIAAQDWDTLQDAVHKLKPAVKNMEIRSLYETIQVLSIEPGDAVHKPELQAGVQKLETVLNQVIAQLKAQS
jgi:CheY-like chemotaxis protein